MTELHPLLQMLLLVAGPTGAAWVGVRVSLNGTRQRVERIETKLDSHILPSISDVRERVARLEGR